MEGSAHKSMVENRLGAPGGLTKAAENLNSETRAIPFSFERGPDPVVSLGLAQ